MNENQPRRHLITPIVVFGITALIAVVMLLWALVIWLADYQVPLTRLSDVIEVPSGHKGVSIAGRPGDHRQAAAEGSRCRL